MANRPTHGDGYEDPAYRTTISYIDRSRLYYASKGFDTPYRWAKNRTAPIARLTKPLSEANIALVTTAKLASPPQDDSHVRTEESTSARQSGFLPFAVPTSDLPPLATDDLFWHKKATNTDDRETFLPVEAVSGLAEQGFIGSLGPRIYGVPTVYSHRRTASYADSVAQWCEEDNVDAVVLVPI